MKKNLVFLSEIDFVSTVFVVFISIYLSMLLLTNLQTYRIDSGNGSYYTNNYTITDNIITFTDVWGRDVTIYNNYAIVVLKNFTIKEEK